ncbi:Rha family transcriptional regulator [Sinorhizobium sp. CCBAU 05631]|uniref:Rha family transcriptional regulator n=1 Tax=Sinorhizobium sp. CCBAU 05631 TaxID=794846 RepID=UPI0004B787E7|nr:Rha family transcriptional regulator [Sinorhizobium sp. CCBAU 05631]ASY55410.1 Phage antirepressor protein [Sinorhizobium sp. CCBAU 05631]
MYLKFARPLVTIKNSTVVANSRDVAAYFGKEHFNVLRDIRALDMPSDLKASFFIPVTLLDRYDRELDGFDMTRDGFSLLAMGFTGAKALQVVKTSANNPDKDRSLTP